MKKDKQKKNIPFAALRKGIVGGLVGLTMIAGGGLLTGCGKDGAPGATGAQGPAGTDGATWYSGIAYSNAQGKVGDFFYDTDDFKIYRKTASGWEFLSYIRGEDGNDGDDGCTWFTGSAVSGSGDNIIATVVDAKKGDLYFNTTTSDVFKCIGENTWKWIANVNGVDGTDGATWISGPTVPTSEGKVGDYYFNTVTFDIYEKTADGWVKIANIESSNQETEEAKKAIGDHYMINNGLTDMAANAVELVVDSKGIAYACYLCSETALGEATAMVKIAKFNILQPTNIEWITVFDRSIDFGGQPLLECNIIDLNSTTVRVFAVNKSNWKYYYKDVNKKTNALGELKEVKFKSSESSDAVEFSKTTVNQYISSIGGKTFAELQTTTKMVYVDGYFYTTAVGGGGTENVLFLKSTNGDTWTLQSTINHTTNYEAMLEYYDGKFWVMCRNGGTNPSSSKQKNLLYSEDGITWTQTNLALETSDTRPYLFKYQGDLYLAYSSPMADEYSTVRHWRCNIHVGRIVADGTDVTFEEIVYKESKFGIVYYALTDWYGSMIMLYSSSEMHPTEGLMGPYVQGKDCLNYTILHSQAPELAFKELESISISSQPNVTEYAVGDTFDATGLSIRAKYSDGSYATITDYSISSPDMSTAGTKTVTVTYDGKSVSFDIVVKEVEKVIEQIVITSTPTKLNYLLNETFDPTGLVVQVKYNVGTPEVITDYTLSTPDMSEVGTETITVTYIKNGVTKTATFTIEISEEILDYVAIGSIVSDGSQYIDLSDYKTKANTKVVIEMERPTDEGVIDASGRWLFSSASNGQSRNFGFCLKPGDAFVLDMGGGRAQTGTINWQDGVNIVEIGNGVFWINDGDLISGGSTSELQTPEVSTNSLYLLSSPTTSASTYLHATIYHVAIYEGNTLVKNLIPAKKVSENNRIGLYDTITGTWYFPTGGALAEGSAAVEKELSNIEIVSNPTITRYAIGQTLDIAGLVVKANYVDGTSKNILTYTVSDVDMSTAGTKAVAITYKGQTVSFNIEVIDVEENTLDSITITSNPTKLTYFVGQTFDPTGLVVSANYTIGAPSVLSATDYQLSTPDMSTAGEKTITVTYTEDGTEVSNTFTITVNEYNELTSVVTDGTQYINLGYKVKANTQIVITMDKPDEDKMGNGWLFQATNNFGFNIKANGAYVLDIGGTRYQTGTINWAEGTKKNTFVIGNGVFTVNGEILADGLNVTKTPTTNTTADLWLLSASNTDNKVYMQTAIYEVKIYEGDELVMHLVPAQSKADTSKIGFYDIVNYRFYYSTPTGTNFIAPTEEE